MRNAILLSGLAAVALVTLGPGPLPSASAQQRIRVGGLPPGVVAPGASTAPAPSPPPAAPATPAAPPTQPAAPATPNPGQPAAAGPGGKPAPAVGPGGKALGDTSNLQQFEQGMEYTPRDPNYRVSFSLEDADLPELVRVMGQLTGKRFIFGGKVRNIKATVYSPQKVTVAEAYQAFLSILETNGLTVVPHGRFLKIIETPGVVTQDTPMYRHGEAVTHEDRYVTRMHRLQHVTADEVANVLGHFKSKDGDITVYGPGNLVIITDTGTNIRRMMQVVQEIDVGGAGDQIWIEPIHYGAASDVANRLNELFDLKGGGAKAGGAPGTPGAAAGGAPGAGSGDLHIAKILPDDRSNALVMVATERAYLRALEFIKRIDVPHSGEGEIHVLPLQHADAIELSKTLTEIISGAAPTGGAPGQPRPAAAGGGASQAPGIFESGVKVSADKFTNALVITSSLRDYAQLRAVIDKLDQPRRQVFIEAAIMDLSISRQNRLGISWHGGHVADFPDGSKQTLIFGGLDAGKSILPPTTALQGAALGVRGPSLPGTENLLGTGFSIPAFGILVNALAQSGDADVLSTPHILATDNIKAVINVGENVPLQTNFPSLPGLTGATGATGAAGLGALGALGGFGGLGALGTSGRAEVGTKITITPHMNDSNEVRLELVEEISEAKEATGSLGVVPITKRNAETTLVVKDQQTVVIGGLMRNRLVKSADKIPILGDIPVLGALFRNTTSTMQKSNLVLVLTPYIIRDQGDLRTVFERKMQERQEFLDRYFVFSEDSDYQPPKDYSRTNGLVEEIRQAYSQMDERKKLEELTRPRDLRTHEPGQPLEMPASGGRPAAPGAPATPGAPPAAPPPGTPPTLHIQPQPRNVDRVER